MYTVVNSDCVGCGACAEICPQVFRINDYEIAEAYLNPVPLDLEKPVKEAAKNCPTAAITFEY